MLYGNNLTYQWQHAGPFCGVVSPGMIAIPGNTVYVEFRSDGSKSFKGFQLNWESGCNLYVWYFLALIYIHLP